MGTASAVDRLSEHFSEVAIERIRAMIAKLRIGWLAVVMGLGTTAGTATAQSCPTCAPSASSCGSRLSPRAWIQSWCAPKQPTICPGSCFGYFRTQWTAWNQVCPNWGANCVEPPIGGLAQPVPVALPPAPAPADAIPPATSSRVPLPKPNVVAAPLKSSPVNKSFVPIPVRPPQPINTRLPLPPTPDLPRS
jgi:hypothetical protein